MLRTDMQKLHGIILHQSTCFALGLGLLRTIFTQLPSSFHVPISPHHSSFIYRLGPSHTYVTSRVIAPTPPSVAESRQPDVKLFGSWA